MANEESDSTDARVQQSFSADEGPQMLGQMMAEGGAEVVGSDDQKVGDLKDQRDAEFTVDRGGIKRDLHIPVTNVSELIGGDVVKLDIPAGQVEEVGWTGGDALGKAKDFSDSPVWDGLGEIFKGRKQKPGKEEKGE